MAALSHSASLWHGLAAAGVLSGAAAYGVFGLGASDAAPASLQRAASLSTAAAAAAEAPHACDCAPLWECIQANGEASGACALLDSSLRTCMAAAAGPKR